MEKHEIKISEQYLARKFLPYSDNDLLVFRYEYRDALWKIEAELKRRGLIKEKEI